MLKSNFFDYNDAYIPVKETIPVTNTVTADANANIGNISLKSKFAQRRFYEWTKTWGI